MLQQIFKYSLIKWYSQLAKITIPNIHFLYPIPSPQTGWTNWSINEVHISNPLWRKIFPCLYIHVYKMLYKTQINIQTQSKITNIGKGLLRYAQDLLAIFCSSIFFIFTSFFKLRAKHSYPTIFGYKLFLTAKTFYKSLKYFAFWVLGQN